MMPDTVRPFALRLKREADKFYLKGKLRFNNLKHKLNFPTQLSDLPKIISPKQLQKAQDLQVAQELVLSKNDLIPTFLNLWKKVILQKLMQ